LRYQLQAFEGIEKYRIDNGRLFPIIVELRVVKTPEEMEVMRYVSDVTSKAHMEVMRQCAPGKREYQVRKN
jgi:Xaa-Pro dipeptidase